MRKAASDPVFAPDDEDGNPGEVVGQEVARLRYLVAEPHQERMAAEQLLPLGRELLAAGVVGHRIAVLGLRHRRRLGVEVMKELAKLGHLVALVQGGEALHVRSSGCQARRRQA